MNNLDEPALTELLRQARTSPRRRSHLLMHGGHDDPVQRLAIGCLRGTYVTAHVHSVQWEMLTVLRGAADLLFYTPEGRLTERLALAPDRTAVVQIPPGQVHNLVVTRDDTVLVEVKPGPFRANEFMDWAPTEGTADAAAYLAWSETAAPGTSFARA